MPMIRASPKPIALPFKPCSVTSGDLTSLLPLALSTSAPFPSGLQPPRYVAPSKASSLHPPQMGVYSKSSSNASVKTFVCWSTCAHVVGIFLGQRPLGDLLGKAESPCRDAAPYGLADGQDVRVEPVLSSVATVACRHGVGFVDDEERPVAAREVAQRVVETRFREHYTDVGHGRLGQHARHVFVGQGFLQRRAVVELDDTGCALRLHRRG